MEQSFALNSINEVLSQIRETLSRADREMDDEGDVRWLVERAFAQTRLLLEAAGLPEALKALQRTEGVARKNYAETKVSVEIGERYLVWAAHLFKYLSAMEILFGEPKAGTVTKDVTQILRETQYSITDRNCFPQSPTNETDVHVRIEAVLRCVFPDLIHKPRITKQIKHYEPDTGLPSIRTLIEYKFISSIDDAKRVSEEVLADTRGYVSKEWDRFIYVIYETRRIKPEKQWDQMLRMSGVSRNTSIIVINGEEPARVNGKKLSRITIPGPAKRKF
jgi:hypothetical protein